MALIGSGAKVIPNVVLTGIWRSLDADQTMAAFAEQLGGIGWTTETPAIYPGNLDSSNFAAGMLLGTSFLAQPNHRQVINSETYRLAGTAHGDYLDIQNIIIAEPMVSDTICLAIGGFSGAGSIGGPITVSVNGRLVATFYVNGEDSDPVAVALASAPIVQAKTISEGLKSGDVVAVNSGAINDSVGTMDFSVVCSIIGRGVLTA